MFVSENNKRTKHTKKKCQNPPRQPSSSGIANSLCRTERGLPRDRLRPRSLRGFSRSFACGRNESDAPSPAPAPSTMIMGGWPVDGKNIGFGGALLMSDSSDSDDEDRSGMSGGGSDNGAAWGGLAAASRRALGWNAEAVCIDLRFFAEEEEGVVVVVMVVGCSLERLYVRSLRAGRAQAFGGTTIGARS